MGMAAFPEWVQSQKLVPELAERLGGALNEANARAILAVELDGPPIQGASLPAASEPGMTAGERGGHW